MRKPFKLEDRHIKGHNIIKAIDPFVAQGLINLLKYQKYKLDPLSSKLHKKLPELDILAYRLHAGKLWYPYGNHWLEAYHEAIHNLIGFKFGTSLKNRPYTVLLNECIGQGIFLYFMAKLAERTDVDVREIDPLGKYLLFNEASLGKSLMKELNRVKKHPFRSFRQAVIESFGFHSRVLEALWNPDRDPEKTLRGIKDALKRSKNLMFLMQGDVSTPTLFVAANCGKTCAQDKRQVKECIRLLWESNSMDDFLIKLGITKYIGEAKNAG